MFKIGGRAVDFPPSPPPLKPFRPSEETLGAQEGPRTVEKDMKSAHAFIEKTTLDNASPPLQDHSSLVPQDTSDEVHSSVEDDRSAEISKTKSGRASVVEAKQASVAMPDIENAEQDEGCKAKVDEKESNSNLLTRKGKGFQRDTIEHAPAPKATAKAKAKAPAQRTTLRQSPRAKQKSASKPILLKPIGRAKAAVVTPKARIAKASEVVLETDARASFGGDAQDCDEQIALPDKIKPERPSDTRLSPSASDEPQQATNAFPRIASTGEQATKTTALQPAPKKAKAAASKANLANAGESSSEEDVVTDPKLQAPNEKPASRPTEKKNLQNAVAAAKDHVGAPNTTETDIQPSAARSGNHSEPVREGRSNKNLTDERPVVFDNVDEDDDLYVDYEPQPKTLSVKQVSHSVDKEGPGANKVSFALPSSGQACPAPKPALPATPPPKTGVVLLRSRIPTPSAKRKMDDARFGIYSSDEGASDDDGFEVIGETRATATKQVTGEQTKQNQNKQRSESFDMLEGSEEGDSSTIRVFTKISSANHKDVGGSSRSAIKKKLSTRRPRKSVLEGAGDDADPSVDAFGFSRSKGIIKAAAGKSVPQHLHSVPVTSRAVKTSGDRSTVSAARPSGLAKMSSPEAKHLGATSTTGAISSPTVGSRTAKEVADDADLEGVISDSDGEADASDTLINPFKTKRGRKRKAVSKATAKKTIEGGLQDARSLLPFRRGTAGEKEAPTVPEKKKRQLELSSSLPVSERTTSNGSSSVISTTSSKKAPARTKKAPTAPRTSNLSRVVSQEDDYALPGRSTTAARRKTTVRKTGLKTVAPVRAQINDAAGSTRPRPRPSASTNKRADGSDDWQTFDAVPAGGSSDAGALLSTSGKFVKGDEASKERTPSSVLGTSRQVNRGFDAIDEYSLEVERV